MGKSKNPGEIIILDEAGSAYLGGSKAAVTVTSKSSRDFMKDPEVTPMAFKIKEKEYRGEVPWGENNDLPAVTIQKIYKNPVVSSGIKFSVDTLYGDGIRYGRYEMKDGKKVFVEASDVDEINEFFENNDINGYHLQACSDMTIFFNVFVEIIFNREKKIVKVSSKEAAFSRFEVMNPKTARIEHHFYSAKWGSSTMKKDEDIDVTRVLDSNGPLRDLRIIMGDLPDDEGNKEDRMSKEKIYRFIIPVNYPTPGRPYYQKPYWFSIFESGWFDFACKIPEFKNALMDNQMQIKYHIELSDDYFPTIFRAEGITEPEAQKARIKKEYQDLNKFLNDHKNSGKSVISFVKYSPEGKELRRMKVTVIEDQMKDGKYIEDSEEASNVMSYGMNVHPSLIGSSPGKSKTINGTEARELWIIKQSQMKPFRDRLLMPLYLIKAINGWPQDIHFAIPNMVLTTLDKGTGSEKKIS